MFDLSRYSWERVKELQRKRDGEEPPKSGRPRKEDTERLPRAYNSEADERAKERHGKPRKKSSRRTPEAIERNRVYMRERYHHPEIREKRKKYQREYSRRKAKERKGGGDV